MLIFKPFNFNALPLICQKKRGGRELQKQDLIYWGLEGVSIDKAAGSIPRFFGIASKCYSGSKIEVAVGCMQFRSPYDTALRSRFEYLFVTV